MSVRHRGGEAFCCRGRARSRRHRRRDHLSADIALMRGAISISARFDRRAASGGWRARSFAGITASVGTNVVGAAQRSGDAVDVFWLRPWPYCALRALGMVSGVLQGVDAVRDLSNPGVSASLFDRVFRSRFRTAIAFRRVVPARIDSG